MAARKRSRSVGEIIRRIPARANLETRGVIMAPDRTRAAASAAIRTSPYTHPRTSALARRLGLTIPPSVRRRADEIHERASPQAEAVVQSARHAPQVARR